MQRIPILCGLLFCLGIGSYAAAGELSAPSANCYWCIRDAIYDDIWLIDRLEAEPFVDEAVKGPQIVAARADIHRLRALLGPIAQVRVEPCCYARKPLYIR